MTLKISFITILLLYLKAQTAIFQFRLNSCSIAEKNKSNHLRERSGGKNNKGRQSRQQEETGLDEKEEEE